jgi:hypothetical protein
MGKKKNSYVLIGNFEVKLSLEGPSHSLRDSIEMGTLTVRWKVIVWIRLAQDGVSSLAEPLLVSVLVVFKPCAGRSFSHDLWTTCEK